MKYLMLLVTALLLLLLAIPARAWEQSVDEQWVLLNAAKTLKLDGQIVELDESNRRLVVQAGTIRKEYRLSLDALFTRNGVKCAAVCLRAVGPGLFHNARLVVNEHGEVAEVHGYYLVFEVRLLEADLSSRRITVAAGENEVSLPLAEKALNAVAGFTSEKPVIILLDYLGNVAKIAG